MPDWTKEQLKAIRKRNSRMLVSAAAGSGKTAVLSERILRRIADPADPVDVDSLLVMTFTKAAAAEMRSRILKGIEEELDRTDADKFPGKSERLKRQAMLTDCAKITTIDSFCLSVIRENVDRTGLDPSFRVGTEEELQLLKNDVLNEVLENCYQKADNAFLSFADSYASGKTDRKLGELILSVYTFAQSTPWPEEWYEKQKENTETDCKKGWEESDWIRYLLDETKLFAQETIRKLDSAVIVCEEADGPSAYRSTLLSDRAKFEALQKSRNYREARKALRNFQPWDRLSRNPKTTDEGKKNSVKAVRDLYKAQTVNSYAEKFSAQGDEEIASDLACTAGAVLTLLLLTQEFEEAFSLKKREKNLVDFNDLEHMALDILWDREENGQREKSAAAKEYASEFREIYVDEYQDSNAVQEMLIRAIEHGEVFMVGDVKQSIYSFRQARPELFMEKYLNYQKDADDLTDGERNEENKGQDTRIDLSKNFRSRESVIESTNCVFRKLMAKSLGGVDYDADAELKFGAAFPSYSEEEKIRGAGETELLLCDTGSSSVYGQNDRETEALMIAGKIRSLTDPERGMVVFDQKNNTYRKAEYSDIVILLRSQKGWAETFVNVLTEEGIPAYAQTNTGYFDTLEVKTILSILAVIDNPLQDIPLAAYLLSPVIGMTQTDLAEMTVFGQQEEKKKEQTEPGRKLYCLYGFLTDEAEKGTDPVRREKANRAVNVLRKYAALSVTVKLSELIRRIYDETGYLSYASALPAGNIRRANLEMLLEKADTFSDTGYRGLFHFIRYIENLKKYDTDFGEASLLGENDNTVCIMSIHRSKGLEFPICIVAGMNKKFNLQDTGGSIILDQKLGIGAEMTDSEKHVKGSTLKKNVIAYRMKSECLGEELRILYVAMTRAKEKLILTGICRNISGQTDKADAKGKDCGMTDVRSAQSELDWILMAYAADEKNCCMREEIIPADTVIKKEKGKRSGSKEVKRELEEWKKEPASSRESSSFLCFRYPHGEDVNLHAKLSVSELKQKLQREDEGEAEVVSFIPEEETESGNGAKEEANSLNGEKTEISAVSRGTVYHRIMEKTDYSLVTDMPSFLAFIGTLREKKIFSEEEIAAVDLRDFVPWFQSPLRKRMADAAEKNKLKRESQFVMTIPAREVDLSLSTEETVLIQGVMDAYWEEEDGHLVLVDYKTDHVFSEEELIRRYRIQLDYYAKALEMMKKRTVSERFIWSFALGKAVSL